MMGATRPMAGIGTTGMALRRVLRRALPAPVSLALQREWIVRRIVGGRGVEEGEVQLLPGFVRPTDVCWDISANSGM
jgi:hypothetical protein